MTNAQANEHLVRRFYELFSQGDAGSMAHLFAEDFLFVPAGKKSPLARPRSGPQEIFEFTREQMELTGGTWIPRPYDILATDRHVVFWSP